MFSGAPFISIGRYSKIKQYSGMCNPPYPRERRNSETPGAVDINGENAIIRLEANVREREQVIP